jgi:hypothetical protein
VVVHEKTFFDEKIAAELAATIPDAARVFVSDIRTGRDEEYVEADMVRQKEWVRILRPAASLLKFRLPWQAGKTPYLPGQILLPAFAPLTSTECRLVLSRAHADAPDQLYDNTEYEQACAFHNTVGRVRTYSHGVRVAGLDHCHDCSMLVAVARTYLQQAGKASDDVSVGAFIESTFEGRTLTSESSRSSNRSRRRFPERSYDGDAYHEKKAAAGHRSRGATGGTSRGSSGSTSGGAVRAPPAASPDEGSGSSGESSGSADEPAPTHGDAGAGGESSGTSGRGLGEAAGGAPDGLNRESPRAQ